MLVTATPEHMLISSHKQEVREDIVCRDHCSGPGPLEPADWMHTQCSYWMRFITLSEGYRDRRTEPTEPIMEFTPFGLLEKSSCHFVHIHRMLRDQSTELIECLGL